MHVLTYINDKLWFQAKEMVKKAGKGLDWVYIVSVYRETLKGYNTIVNVVIDSKQYQIVTILEKDTDNVILIDSDYVAHIKPYSEVLTAKKIFFFNKASTYEVKKIKLPQGVLYKDNNYINIKI